jgi:hypothetical protein
MKKIWKEFQEFAVKGHAVDLAVGVIIGAAFGQFTGQRRNHAASQSPYQLRRPAEKGSDEKTCPACAMKIPIKATPCPHCTSESTQPTTH